MFSSFEKMRKAVPIFFLLGTGFLIYSNTFHSSFQFDDHAVIVENFFIRDISNWPLIFNAFNTRFIVGLSLALNYWIGKLDPFSYHVVNLAIHLATSVLLYLFLNVSFETPALKKTLCYPHRQTMSFFAASFFLLHPVQTQAVTYIWQRCACLATLFYLGSIFSYAKSKIRRSRFWYFLSVFLFLMALMSKEIAVTLPAVLLIYDQLFFKPEKKFDRHRFLSLTPYFLGLIVIPVLLLRSSHVSLDLMKPASADIYRFVSEKVMPAQTYYLTQLRVLLTYIRLIFLPFKQNLDYDYPLVWSFSSPEWVVPVLLILASLYFSFRYFKINPTASFGVLWFFITLLPEAFVVQKDVIFEHRLYLPMVGAALCFSEVCSFFIRRRKATILMFAVSGIFLMLGVLTYQRNSVWKNGLILSNDTILKSPRKARPYAMRAVYYIEKKEWDKSIEDFTKAIQLEPTAELYNSRGDIYIHKEDYAKALDDFNFSIRMNSKNADAYNNRGTVYSRQKKYQEALKDFDKAIQIKPSFFGAFYNRANAYQYSGKFDEAIQDYETVIQFVPTMAEARNNLAVTYYFKGEYDKSLRQATLAEKMGFRVSDSFLRNLKNKADNITN